MLDNSDKFASRLDRLVELARRSIADPNEARVFVDELNKLLDDGWNWALPPADLPSETRLPARYLAQRQRVLDHLEIQVGRCASAYRASAGGADTDAAVAAYHEAFGKLTAVAGKVMALDPDAELPDHLMPPEYKAQFS